MVTLKDVAERAQVNVATVSRFLNDRGYISAKTRKVIQQAMKDLNYQPNEIARALSLKKSNFIGLIVPSASNLYFCNVVDRAERHAAMHGYKLLLCISYLDLKKEIEYFDLLRAHKVAGVILASHTQNIDEHIAIDEPVISIERDLSPQIPSVCSDNYQGGVLAAEHLIAKGCKALAYISGSTYLNLDSNKRYYGFKDVCEKNGIPVIFAEATDAQFLSMNYQSTIIALLDNNPHIDGIFTSNDIIAAQVLKLCRQKKIAVPEQMKIVGYDDIALCTLCTPSITTIRQSVDTICRYAVESIVFKKDDGVIPTSIVIPVSLVERETS